MERATTHPKKLLRKATPDSSAKAHSKRRRTDAAQHDGTFERECLELLFGILVASGLSISRLRTVSEEVCAGLTASRRRWNAADLGYFAQLAHILSLWHLRSGYVDAQAAPRPLRLAGSGPSLSKLIAMVFPRANPKEVLATLVRVGAVRRRGQRWLPRGRTLVFKSAHVARLRILSDLARFLRTAQHNVAHPRGKLLQLSAFNPEIPAAEFPELHARMHERARQFLIEQDTALSRHEGTARGSHRSAGVGIGVYVFRDPPAADGPPLVDAPRLRKGRSR